MTAMACSKRVAIQWVFLVLVAKTMAQECNFNLELATGQIYEVSYPNSYGRGVNCFWSMRSFIGSNVVLSCMVNMPWSPNCRADRLLVSKSGNRQFTDANVYCGSGSFSLTSTGNQMTVGSITRYFNGGGNFSCTATAIKASNPSTESAANIQSECDCGWKQVNRIVGGVETGIHEFPFMAALIYRGSVFCGASIISNRFSLTAGHCVAFKDPAALSLLVGDHNIATGEDTPDSALYNIDAYEVYPNYNQTNNQNDIALVRAKTQVLFSPNVGPVCLPFRFTYQTFVGQPVIILGWGQVEFSGPLSNTLQKAQVQVISTEQCDGMQAERIINGEICTYSNEVRDSCQSDSGGPVIWYDTSTQRYQIVGIISHGGACGSYEPGINTRVSEYLQWIVDRTNTSYCVK